MNRDDIIRMAIEAGLLPSAEIYKDDIEKFASLIAAAEREECAKLCEESPERLDSDGFWRTSQQACADAIRARGQS
jgi:hypothetical protein